MQLLDGRAVAETVLARVRQATEEFSAQGVHLKLVVIQCGQDPASSVYIRQKLKRARESDIISEHVQFENEVTTETLVKKIHELNADKNVHGILVQLPLPKHIDTPLVMRAIDPKKDVDGFTAYNIGKMMLGSQFEHLAPCTPTGVIELLSAYDIDVSGKEVVMVGASNIVGKPLAVMLLNRGATVTVCHILTKNLAEHTRKADILCVAVGKEKLITADMVKEGVVVVDIGINRRDDGTLTGDCDFGPISQKASYITPVPGGVGQMTVACLMENIVRAAKRQRDE